jgi:hypothetical protein
MWTVLTYASLFAVCYLCGREARLWLQLRSHVDLRFTRASTPPAHAREPRHALQESRHAA